MSNNTYYVAVLLCLLSIFPTCEGGCKGCSGPSVASIVVKELAR